MHMTQQKLPGEEENFYILREQKELLVERDYEIVDEISKSYLEEAGVGDGLKESGDLKQRNLHFTNVKSCPREVYYKFHEPHRSRKRTVKGLILFEDGKLHHINIQRRLEDRRKTKNPEGFLTIPEVEATGYYDQLVTVDKKENGEEVCDIFEIKSKLPFACEAVSQEDYDQAQLYHYAAQFSERLKSKRIKIRAIRLFYKDRAIMTDDVHFGYFIQPDPDRQKQILDYFRFLKSEVINNGLLVPHPYEKDSNKCIYCRFRDWCWRDYPDQVEESDDGLSEVVPAEKEIVDTIAKRYAEILEQEKELRDEKKKLEPTLLKHFSVTKQGYLPLSEDDALAVREGKSTNWDEDGLLEALGADVYARVSSPKKSKITEYIKAHNIDAGKFERFKTQKKNKPSIYITKNGGK
jgi:hypothetical protein